jgi:hypothetical protein
MFVIRERLYAHPLYQYFPALQTELFKVYFYIIFSSTPRSGTTVAQWLMYCATNRKVPGSIPDGVIGIFH